MWANIDMRINCQMPTLGAMRTWLTRVTTIPGLLALLTSGLFSVAAPAQGFSNATNFTVGAAQVVVEDIAVCTKYKYPFSLNSNGGSTWPQTGYETCISESITTDSLPATLHMKFRLQSKNPDEFLASIADASIVDAKGVQVNTPRWAPTPFVNLDGPFNQKDGIFYGAFLIAGSNLFPAGSYSVRLQFWNSQWTKIKGPVEEIPNSLNVFAFNIYPGKSSSASTSTSTNSSLETCKWDAGFSASLSKTRATLALYTQKVNALTDFSAPGLMDLLDAYLSDIKKESLNISGLVNQADLQYRNSKNCDEYLSFLAESASYSAELGKTQALISGYYAKAKAMAGNTETATDPNWCVTQSNAAISSIKNSINVLTQYSAKADSGMDLSNPSTTAMLKGWLETIEGEYKNLSSWQEKLPEYIKREPGCAEFVTGSALNAEGIATYKNVVAKISTVLNKAASSQNKPKSVADENLSDEDGVEEEPEAKLSVTYSTSLGRFIIKVESNLPEETLTIRATRKGSKALRFTINTNEEGAGGLRTRARLSGYTLVLSFDSIRLDSLRVR